MPQIIGGLITIVAVLIIAGYGFYQANAHKTTTNSSGPALTDPSKYNPKGAMLKVGATAPDFTLKDINGKSYNLAAQKGHPVFLEFFAVWCPHCQHEAPIVQKLSTQYASKGVRVWSVLANPYGPNYDASLGQDRSAATKQDVQQFSSLYSQYDPKLIDPSFNVVNEYGISSYPGLYVIDKTGKIVYSNSGETPQSALTSAINKALKS
jgi:peroxiredoxin